MKVAQYPPRHLKPRVSPIPNDGDCVFGQCRTSSFVLIWWLRRISGITGDPTPSD
jgi:hypothetical protein